MGVKVGGWVGLALVVKERGLPMVVMVVVVVVMVGKGRQKV